ncbi:phage tail protein [Streptomyces sp. N35]|uniref:phage tail protein n=1 Tax=Streptomyces sp. N35 TaxID=2795730 RepID=UPI0018F5D06A|nr:phage tail protein [Streptomyces sp. N35]
MSFLIASGHVNVEARTDKALSAITGVVAAMGALGPAGAVAAGSMAAAGAGMVAFGLAAGKQVANIAKASQAQTKYKKAVEESGKTSEKAAKAQNEYARTMAKMPQATRETAASFMVMKDAYSKWSDSLADDTMPVFTKTFQTFSALLPKTSGLVRGTSRELDRLMTVIAGGVASPGFDRFMVKVEKLSSAALNRMTDGLINLSQTLNTFGDSSQFERFMDNAREAGPIISETLGNLGRALLHLMEAGSDVGISLLHVANALAELVSAIPPEVLGTLLQLYAAFKLVKLGAAGVIALSGGMAGFAASLAAMRAASLAAGGGLAGLAAAFGVLSRAAKGTIIVAGIAAAVIAIQKLSNLGREAPPNVDRLTTSLKELGSTGRLTGEGARVLGEDFGKLHDVVAKVADPSISESINNWGADITNGFLRAGDSTEDLIEKMDGIDSALANLVEGGHADLAAAAIERMTKGMSPEQLKEFKQELDNYKEGLRDQKLEQELAAGAMGLFGEQAMATKSKLDAQKQSADGLRQSIQALNDVNRAALGGMIGFEASIDAAAKAAKENAGSLRMINGELDTNSPKAQAAATALADLAAKTDAATAAARESNAPWEKINGIYSRGRSELIKYAQQMGLSSAEATQFADSILKIPNKAETRIEMHREDAIAGLDAVISKIKSTPGSKSVTVGALTDGAIRMLEDVGFRTKKLPSGKVQVTAITGSALSNIKAVQRARDGLASKTITITTRYVVTGSSARTSGGQGSQLKYASGGPVRGYASGGGIQAFPMGGLAIGPGTGTSDSIPALVSNGEWVMKAAAVARYGTRFMAAINDGRLPKFAKGGLTQAQKDARKSLTSDVTFTTAGKMAGFKNAEMSRDLGTPDSVSALAGTINTYLSQIKAAFTGKTESSLVGKMTASGKALLAHQKKLEGVNKSLDAAKSNFEDLKGKFDSLKTSISSSLISFGNITKVGKYGTSPETLIKQLTADAGRTTQFAGQLEQLKARGLNGQMIEDIASAGVTGGGMATAQSLLAASPEQIARINELQKQLTTSANKAGTVAADAMYGAGLRAAEGLVKGLTAQQSAIESAMMKIAKSMEAAIKKALGIKSPSRVMMQLGQHTADGFNIGVASRKSLITAPNKMSIQAPSSAAAQTGPTINLTVNVNSNDLASSPAERRRIANLLVKETNDALRIYQRERSVSR